MRTPGKFLVALGGWLGACNVFAQSVPLESVEVQVARPRGVLVCDGRLEAERRSELAVQVAGRVLELTVSAGDHVTAGQLLARIDGRIATHLAQAQRARVAALEADLTASTADLARQRQLYDRGMLNQSAFEQVDARFKAANANTRAQLAEASLATVEEGLHVLTAPYDAVITAVATEVGAMAEPARTLLTLFDPSALRVAIDVPQRRLGFIRDAAARIEIAGADALEFIPTDSDLTVLPEADPVSRMVTVRLRLPPGMRGVVPGLFARVVFHQPMPTGDSSLSVPARAVVHHAEFTAVYVLVERKPQLRLVRTGRTTGPDVEILAGLELGERVVLNPLVAIPPR